MQSSDSLNPIKIRCDIGHLPSSVAASWLEKLSRWCRLFRSCNGSQVSFVPLRRPCNEHGSCKQQHYRQLAKHERERGQ